LANGTTGQQIKALEQQLDQAESQAQNAYLQWQCQLYGTGPGCQQTHPGNGQLARVAQQSYESATAQTRALEDQLAAARSAAAHLQQSFNSSNARPGLLARLNALEKVAESSGVFTATQWLLFLLFAVIAWMPIIVRTAQVFRPQNTYEKILRIRELEDIRIASQHIKTR
jgi:hypothetical protein